MNLAEAAERAKRGNAILFLGSGFGRYGKNADGDSLPSGDELARMLSEELKEPEGLPLARVADIAADELSPEQLDEFLRRKLTPCSAEDQLDQLVRIPWARVYTTNYDTLFEIASQKIGLKSDTLTPSSPIIPYKSQSDIVHIHGAIPPKGRAYDSIVLGDESYLTSEFVRSPWYHVFLNDISTAKAVIFLGYSISDIDLGRLIVSRPDISEKICIVTGPALSSRERVRLSKFGEVHAVGYEGLRQSLVQASDLEPLSAAPFVSLKAVELPSEVRPANSEDAFRLFGLGMLNPSAFLSQLRNGGAYSIKRQSYERIMLGIDAGVTRALVHSHFGNGKSILFDEIAIGLRDRGFDVYTVGTNSFSLDEELARVREMTGKRAILFDNALRNRNIFMSTCSQMPTDVVVVGSTRTLSFVTEYQHIFQIMPSMSEYNLNELRTEELSELSNSLTYFGLWGNLERSEHEKIEFLRIQCKSEIRSTVLYLFENSSIAGQINEWIRDLLGADSRLVTAVVAALIFAKANLSLSLEEILFLSDIEVSWFQRTATNGAVGEILDLNGTRGQIRSPVLADYLIEKSFSTEKITEVLWTILKQLHDSYDIREYQYFSKQLLKFSFLVTIFGNDRKSDAIVSFYDNVRTLANFRSDPQFWIQFAMIRLEREEWKLAETYFENAYSYARKSYSQYRTFMIDDQYARFLLLSRAAGYKAEESFSSFIRASRIVTESLRADSSDVYPFRTARFVHSLIAAQGESFRMNERLVVINFCKSIVQLIDRADQKLARFGEMSDCRSAMQEVLTQYGVI